MGEPETSTKARRRRSKAKAKPKAAPTGFVGALRTAMFGRCVAGAMLVITAVYVWQVWNTVSHAGQRLGSVELGMTAVDVSAALGPTVQSGSTGADLIADQDGRIFVVRLDGPERRAAVLTCREAIITAPACPPLLGIRIGHDRAAVLRELGAGVPRREGNREFLDYPQVGIGFGFADGKVSQLTVKAPAVPATPWKMLLSRLIP